MKTTFIFECPICNMRHELEKIKKGQILEFVCHDNFYITKGCKIKIKIILS